MFTVAIGHAPNSWFMRKTAEIGRGSFVHIAKPDEVETQMSALWGRIQLPALTDICVNWGDTAEYFPEVIPDLYAGEPLWLLARLPAEPTMIGLCGELNEQNWELNVNGWDAASSGPGGDNLAKLWARKKIEALEDGLMFGADPELTQLEITGLALDYGLLTRYTSMVAVDRTPRRNSGESLALAEVPGLLPTGSSAQLAGYPSTATGWVAQLLLSLFVLLLATCMLLFSGSRLPMTKIAVKT
jgi:Ca-activated chloride channel family protein